MKRRNFLTTLGLCIGTLPLIGKSQPALVPDKNTNITPTGTGPYFDDVVILDRGYFKIKCTTTTEHIQDMNHNPELVDEFMKHIIDELEMERKSFQHTFLTKK